MLSGVENSKISSVCDCVCVCVYEYEDLRYHHSVTPKSALFIANFILLFYNSMMSMEQERENREGKKDERNF